MEERIRNMKVIELKDELRKMKKQVYGVKYVLIDPLLSCYSENHIHDEQPICSSQMSLESQSSRTLT